MTRSGCRPGRALDRSFAKRYGADTPYLYSMLDGSINLVDPDLVNKLDPMFEKYAEDTDMMALLNRAANAYGDTAVAKAKEALTTMCHTLLPG